MPRQDTRGIVDAEALFTRVRFRRHDPVAPALRPYVEHYWLIDWDLETPYASNVVPHPSVNIVFQRYGDASSAEVSGIGLELFEQKLEGVGRVCGVQFRPGGFRPFAPGRPVSDWTGRRVPLTEAFPDAFPDTFPDTADATTPHAILDPPTDEARVAALDAFLLTRGGPEGFRPDPAAERAMELVDLIRTGGDGPPVRRVDELADRAGLSVRSLQRLFAAYVGVAPKWVVLRYRIHEALERAEADRAAEPDWAALAAELGYSDQAHLVRDFTATVGVPPTAYARALRAS
ncbi:AraC family transcriptional regulator [Streptomyces solicathayae]|uniref:AraC family transcriptional regulator n=1 Tax=Streptomyces solicathayae TaxID=3081768 RepID=A0ABZ0LVM3_9ACTN|nr:AraC family transcriptional regulator [Streptomyces sp. HUAS YS2]WOX22844.1 AraC family transcriptional regulator [Streptomyces sp. HUAS YS2]